VDLAGFLDLRVVTEIINNMIDIQFLVLVELYEPKVTTVNLSEFNKSVNGIRYNTIVQDRPDRSLVLLFHVHLGKCEGVLVNMSALSSELSDDMAY